MRRPPHPVASAAAVLLLLEAAGLVVLAGFQIAAVVGGDLTSVTSSIALIALTAIGAAIVVAFAAGVAGGASWGRSGGIVVQLLIIGVAIGAATGAYAHPVTGLVLAVPAVVGFVLLVLAARAAARARPGSDTDAE